MANLNEFPKRKSPEEEKNDLRKRLEGSFSVVSGLSFDALCVFPAISVTYDMRTVKTYEEYFKEKYPDHYEFIMENSSPESVSRYNRIVEAFNVTMKQLIAYYDEEKNPEPTEADYEICEDLITRLNLLRKRASNLVKGNSL